MHNLHGHASQPHNQHPYHLYKAYQKHSCLVLTLHTICDMDVDYEAAKRAQVNYVHALWGYGTCNDGNVIKLENITQLLDIILNE
jgi:hypothetical protein